MAFSLTAEQTAVREAVREFGENEIEPLGKECDREKRYPAELMEQAAQYDLIAPEVPEKYGGAGRTASLASSSPRNSGGPTRASGAPSAPVASGRA